MDSDGPARRREIEDSTAARLAEIVAAAERAAKQVIDEAEAEARSLISDAREEADRIVAARLAGLGDLTEEISAQAEALARQAEALQQALARAKAEIGEPEGGDPASNGRRAPGWAPEPAQGKPATPALTVVGGIHEEAEPPASSQDPVEAAPASSQDPVEEIAVGSGSSAGARLLATQMAVSGSSRSEIEARLRDGFAITDTRPILDAILGPEN